MKKLRRKLYLNSVITLLIMCSGVWGVFGPFELNFCSPEISIIISACSIMFGFMAFITNLNIYIYETEKVETNQRHSISMMSAYNRVQEKDNEIARIKWELTKLKVKHTKLLKKYTND